MATTPKKHGGAGATSAAQKKKRSLVMVLASALAIAAICGVIIASLTLSSAGDEATSSNTTTNRVGTTSEDQTDGGADDSDACEVTQCKAGGSEVCGTNGVTYLNECYFKKAHCKDKSIERVKDWKGYNCPHTCKKQIACNEVGIFLCASDGNVYFGYCNLYIAQCLDPTVKEVECDKAIFEGMFQRPTSN